jgi:hypothetical protein
VLLFFPWLARHMGQPIYPRQLIKGELTIAYSGYYAGLSLAWLLACKGTRYDMRDVVVTDLLWVWVRVKGSVGRGGGGGGVRGLRILDYGSSRVEWYAGQGGSEGMLPTPGCVYLTQGLWC